jgi:prepilin-type N-terminal cleavage/methylation domain-containing protein
LIHRNARQTFRGFTLIELLVVIAIVALLVAMLMPVLGSARETSRRVICAAQLQQWGRAAITYADDNRGDFPGVTAWGANDLFTSRDGIDSSKLHLEAYGILRQITQCPSRQQPRNYWYDIYPGTWCATDYFHFFGRADRPDNNPVNWPIDWNSPAIYFYGWTISYWDFTGGRHNRSPVPNLYKHMRSSKTVLAYDRSWTPTNPGYYYDNGDNLTGFDSQSNHLSSGQGAPKWAAGANYLLIDGSVHWEKLDDGNVYFLGGHDYYRNFVVGEKLRYP